MLVNLLQQAYRIIEIFMNVQGTLRERNAQLGAREPLGMEGLNKLESLVVVNRLWMIL